MIRARYILLDVFTERAFAGNQLAIFPECVFDDVTMQHIARELNLAESVFLTRGQGGEAGTLRIFTPGREVLFAGHPTIGTAIALVDELRWVDPGVTSFVLRERIGNIPITIERDPGTMAWFTTPPTTFGDRIGRAMAASMLNLPESDVRDDVPVQFAGAGSRFLFVPLQSRDAVDRAVADESVARGVFAGTDAIGIYLFAQSFDGCYARMFAPMSGISEDPATGSATGPLYAYLTEHGVLPKRDRFLNLQGVAMGRRSELHVRCFWKEERLTRIDIGGRAVVVGRGELSVPIVEQADSTRENASAARS